MLGYEELTEPERAVWNAIETGALVELPLAAPVADDPATGETWGWDRQVRAQLLYELLTGVNGPKEAHPRALKLVGARITGTLDVEAATLSCSLNLRRCSFEQPINLQEAQTRAVRLPGCSVPGLNGEQLHTRGDLQLNDGFTVQGQVNLLGAHIGGNLVVDGARLSNPKGCALNGDKLTVDQSMFLRWGFRAQGEINLVGAHIGSNLELDGASLANPKGRALTADALTVDQNMLGRRGFSTQGEVRLTGAHIVGSLQLDGARLINPDGYALTAEGLTIDQAMFCRSGFTALGELRLIGAHIERQLSLTGAILENPEGIALNADGLTVSQNMFCTPGFTAQGEINLVGAHIGGNLEFDGATLTSPKGRALSADGLTVDRTMFCRSGFNARGQVNLVGAHIGGTLEFDGATLTNSDGYALTADAITVDQGVLCRAGFSAHGEVRLVGAYIRGMVNFNGATLINPGGTALNLKRIRGDTLLLQPEVRPEGTVDLSNAQVDTCYDNQPTWAQDLRLDGFTYGALIARPEVGAATRLRWLESDPGDYTPQLYEQLAAVYRRAGRDNDARKVAIAKQRRRRRTLDRPGKVWNSLLRWTVGFGYETWKAGVWLLILVGLGWIIFDYAHRAHLLIATKPPGQRPWFYAAVYALDLLLPFADLGYQGAWIADGWARPWYLIWNLAGWVLVTAVVAALSGLIKRD
jgi:hypothetical protein